MHSQKHILVIRFSAMGDVAMTVPVIKNLLEQNPHLEVTVVSNAFFAPLFSGLERCHFHPAELKTVHKGIGGIYKLFRELANRNRFDAIADLHGVLRSSLLRTFFKLGGHKTAVIDKGRQEKAALTRKEKKVFKQLTTSHERYAAVFRQLGVSISLSAVQTVYEKKSLPVSIQTQLPQNKRLIGVAPFAQHAEKMYPLEKMKAVVKTLAASNNVLLFGGGAEEAFVLQQWAGEIAGTVNVAGKFSFADELSIISNLNVMISMDSANMHLASLFNVPVVSIWGATHHYAGFYGWGQDENNIVSVDLSCRPCSVFGNKPCWRGDHACMQRIDESMIIQKIDGL